MGELGASFVTLFGLNPWVLPQELLRPLESLRRQEHLFVFNEMPGSWRRLGNFRIWAGHKEDQGMIRGLELQSPVPSQPPGIEEGLEIELITNGQ